MTLAGNAALTRTVTILTGPIGWEITALWSAVDIADATIPAVIEIASIRSLMENREAVELIAQIKP